MPFTFTLHVDTATAPHNLRGYTTPGLAVSNHTFDQSCLAKVTSIPRIIGAVLAKIGFVSYFPAD